MLTLSRRDFIATLGMGATLSALGVVRGAPTSRNRGRVVVIGGGFGGATCAKYLRRLDRGIQVILVEPTRHYLTCPFSNLVVSGLRELDSLGFEYSTLRDQHGVQVLRDRAVDIDPAQRRVLLDRGGALVYDRLVLAPGIAIRWDSPQGYDQAASQRMPHAWRAGEQTLLLRRQLAAMPAAGLVAISVPVAPFRCPPGPYERASLIAHYLKAHKPRAKVLILDSNQQFSKQSLFFEAWRTLYPGMIEWVPISNDGAVRRVDAKSRTLFTELERHKVDVANVIPAQKAAQLAERAGLIDDSGWCPVEQGTFESTRAKGIHVLGDAALAGAMPKSASSANSQAKVCALAIAAYLRGEPPAGPSYHNTCYSLVAPDYGISVSAIYRLQHGTITPVKGAGGVSPIAAGNSFRALEAQYAQGWYASITRDTFF